MKFASTPPTYVNMVKRPFWLACFFALRIIFLARTLRVGSEYETVLCMSTALCASLDARSARGLGKLSKLRNYDTETAATRGWAKVWRMRIPVGVTGRALLALQSQRNLCAPISMRLAACSGRVFWMATPFTNSLAAPLFEIDICRDKYVVKKQFCGIGGAHTKGGDYLPDRMRRR